MESTSKNNSPPSSSFNKTIAVGPLQTDNQVYLLHRKLSEQEMQFKRSVLEEIKNDIGIAAPFTPSGNESLVWPLGTEPPSKPKIRFDMLRWHFFSESHIYFDCDFSNVRELKGVEKLDITDIMKTSTEHLNLKHQSNFIQKRLLSGYRRFDASRGMEYIVDLLLSDQSVGRDVIKRVHLLRPLGNAEIVPMPYVTENTRVNLVLPVYPDEKDGVLSFIDSYAHTCLESGDNAYLLIVFVYETKDQQNDDIYSMIKSTVTFYENKYHNSAHVTWTAVRISSNPSLFAVMDAVSRRLSPESLIVCCTVGMELSIEFLNRVRMNTISGWQVYFPIGYWSYKPNLIYEQLPYPTVILINQKSGHYDFNQYLHSSFYITDYLYARKQMIGVGTALGTIDLYEMFVRFHSLHVLRAIEPALRLQFRLRKCNKSVMADAEDDCQKSRSHGLASRAQLAMLMFEYQQKLDQIQLLVMHQQHGENVGQMKPEMLKKR